MAWIMLLIAGILEVVWAGAMKQSAGFTRLLPTAIMGVSMIGSFGLLALAMRELPLSTAYTIWVGIGAVGAFVVGVTLLGEAVTPLRVLAALLIIAGIVTMKLA
ncbi:MULTISPECIES: multidrug efflux SMR transporter [unclassified Ruegeria]|uniref:DMT family transporter n=1 Tax=unclassified Ruegeria TaxID=2625375 RepID=UPI00148802F1|nr:MULTISPECIES: multidrug efflux SMR transporter [unclassified Ruegeria]NOD33608.1 QacE family quaternary ammonium compound efflux SMR transporter [Ruegeria sp. HKCCD7296]NOD46093.1 QacE family quaternary ammonium compound efflux SMR transporter [Ruegeria sp. HKCCD5849]NOD50607.1 QacE family quaternary ammonium compound efflux SMR transporter [Ruegeria sp. HKCCD5851]NOD67423.1 QacE family quaternary ammonium compound efflux SMR transporter [Ruegeria sp. HKCCD7303]NOE33009.1 QacE family quater